MIASFHAASDVGAGSNEHIRAVESGEAVAQSTTSNELHRSLAPAVVTNEGSGVAEDSSTIDVPTLADVDIDRNADVADASAAAVDMDDLEKRRSKEKAFTLSFTDAHSTLHLGVTVVSGCVALALLSSVAKRVWRRLSRSKKGTVTTRSRTASSNAKKAETRTKGHQHICTQPSAARDGGATGSQSNRADTKPLKAPSVTAKKCRSHQDFSQGHTAAADANTSSDVPKRVEPKTSHTLKSPAPQDSSLPSCHDIDTSKKQLPHKKRVPPSLSGNKARGLSKQTSDTPSQSITSPESAVSMPAKPPVTPPVTLLPDGPNTDCKGASSPESIADSGGPAGTSLPEAAQESTHSTHPAESAPTDVKPAAHPIIDVPLSAAAPVFRSHRKTSEAAQSDPVGTAVSGTHSAEENGKSSGIQVRNDATGDPAPEARVPTAVAAAAQLGSGGAVGSARQLEKVTFNVDAPPWNPSSASSHSAGGLPRAAASIGAVQTSKAPDPSRSIESAAIAVGDLTKEGKPVDTVDDSSAAEAVEECSDEEGAEFVHQPLQLHGKDIDANAAETSDEKEAGDMLLRIAQDLRSLGAAQATPQQLRDRGRGDLKADVDFCITHNCRPRKVAEHASTAADFFFQLQMFEAAEEMLDIGIQAARMAGDLGLETTLVHNLASSLRKRGKLNMALALHQHFKQDIERREGITSAYVVVARHNICDLLTTMHGGARVKECRLYLDQELEKLEAYAARIGSEVSDESKDGASPIAAALQAVARCQMDYAKHYATTDNPLEAIKHGKAALEKHRAAQEEGQEANPVYINFLASELRKQGQREKEAGQVTVATGMFKESRELFIELAQMVESRGARNRNLPTVYRQLVEISTDMGDMAEALKFCDKFVSSIIHVYNCRASDPVMQQAWEFKASVYASAGDESGAAAARKMMLKCKSSALSARSNSHKSKHRK